MASKRGQKQAKRASKAHHSAPASRTRTKGKASEPAPKSRKPSPPATAPPRELPGGVSIADIVETLVTRAGRPGAVCERTLDDPKAWPPRHAGRQCRGFHDGLTPPGRPTSPNPLPEVTGANQEAFLSSFAMVGSIRGACRLSGVGRSTFYDWKDNDPAFVKRFDLAVDEYADRVDEEIHERGIEGWEEPVIGRISQYEDGVVTYIRKKSDPVLLALARGVRPNKYGKQRLEHTGADGAPLIDLTKLDADELVLLRRVITKAGTRPTGQDDDERLDRA